jgi:hypothetical protein
MSGSRAGSSWLVIANVLRAKPSELTSFEFFCPALPATNLRYIDMYCHRQIVKQIVLRQYKTPYTVYVPTNQCPTWHVIYIELASSTRYERIGISQIVFVQKHQARQLFMFMF